MKRRIFVNIGVLLVCVLVGYYCFVTGKAYTISLENVPYTLNGVQYEPLEAIQATIDGRGDPVYMLADDHMTSTAVGTVHTIELELLDGEDKVIETKSFPFTVGELGEKRSINIPAAFALGKLPKSEVSAPSEDSASQEEE